MDLKLRYISAWTGCPLWRIKPLYLLPVPPELKTEHKIRRIMLGAEAEDVFVPLEEQQQRTNLRLSFNFRSNFIGPGSFRVGAVQPAVN